MSEVWVIIFGLYSIVMTVLVTMSCLKHIKKHQDQPLAKRLSVSLVTTICVFTAPISAPILLVIGKRIKS